MAPVTRSSKKRKAHPDSSSPLSEAASLEDPNPTETLAEDPHPTDTSMEEAETSMKDPTPNETTFRPQSIVDTLRSLSESPGLTDTALEAQAKLSGYTPRDPKDHTVQILQSFIDLLPPRGKQVIEGYVTINGDDKLYQLAMHLKTAVLIPIKAQGGKTPQVSPSPLSDTGISIDDVAAEMTQSNSRKDQVPLKNRCLARDDYRCVVTGIWDDEFEEKCPAALRGTHIGKTELAHIIPFSMGQWDDDTQGKAIAETWGTLYALFPDLRAVLKPESVNCAENAMTMLDSVRKNFGSLKLAFIPTDTENTYRIKTYRRFSTYLFQSMPPPNEHGARLVTFEQHADDSELPSRVLLATHAAIAEILHASGQGEQIEELLDDWNSTQCMASDGSTDLETLLSLVHVY